MTCNVVTTRDLVRIHSDLVGKFLSSLLKANEFISTNPDLARDIAARHIGDYGRFFANEWKNYSFSLTLDQSLILNLEEQGRNTQLSRCHLNPESQHPVSRTCPQRGEMKQLAKI